MLMVILVLSVATVATLASWSVDSWSFFDARLKVRKSRNYYLFIRKERFGDRTEELEAFYQEVGGEFAALSDVDEN